MLKKKFATYAKYLIYEVVSTNIVIKEKDEVLPHFFIQSNTITDDRVEISDKNTYDHIAKSLRAKVGERLLLIDENQIQYDVLIDAITKNSILSTIKNSKKSARKLDFQLYLAQSPLKSDAQNLVIEKATELGLAGVFPIFTDNCALKKSFVQAKIEKYQKIMFEASKQCERADIPVCYDLSTLEKVIKADKFDKMLAFTERSANHNLRQYLEKNPIKKNQKILVIIGPEGGFSQKEFEFFEQNAISTLSLGELILKAETAVVVALGNIIYEYNN